VSDRDLRGGQRRALVGLDVRPKRTSGVDGHHRGEVVVEDVGVDDQGRGLEFLDVHATSVPRPDRERWFCVTDLAVDGLIGDTEQR
jgi:hypothetical protein